MLHLLRERSFFSIFYVASLMVLMLVTSHEGFGQIGGSGNHAWRVADESDAGHGVAHAAQGLRPTISQVSPPSVPMSSNPVIINIFGSNFLDGSAAELNGVAQPTVYVNGYLRVTISPSFLGNMRELRLTVANGTDRSAPFMFTVYRVVPLEASDVVYDPIGKRLWASLPASATRNPNTVVSISPGTGAIGKPIAVANDPQRLAVSNDGQYLYVALNGSNQIQRIVLKTRTIDRTFPIPVDPAYGQTTAEYMSVVPGSPELLVTALFRNASPAEDGIALYNDTGLVNWLVNEYQYGYPSVDSFTFAGNPPVVYTVPFTVPTSFFQIYDVNGAGITAVSAGYSNTYENAAIASDGTLLYVADGSVWNPTTQSEVGSIQPPLFDPVSLIPDAVIGRTYFLDEFASNGVTVESYNHATLTLHGSVTFPSFYPPDVFALNRWGLKGFAFQVGNFIPTGQSNQLILFVSSI
jgi:hypothetical protein